MERKKPVTNEVPKKRVIKKEPKPGTWAAVVKGADYAKKAGLQNWPG